MFWFFTFCFLVLVCGRFFVSTIRVLPQLVTFIDFLAYPFALLGFLFAALSRKQDRPQSRGWLILAFIVITAISLVINLNNTRVGLGVLYVFTMVGGPAVAGILGTLADPGERKNRRIQRMLRIVTILNIVILILVNVPMYFILGNPDVVSGTFGYQGANYFVVYAGIQFGIVLGNFAGKKAETRWFVINYILWIVVFVLAQFRAVSIGFILSNILTLYLLYQFVIQDQRTRRIITRIAVTGAILYFLIFPRFERAAETAYETGKFEDVFAYLENPQKFMATPKALEAMRMFQLFQDEPLAIFFGTGPGSMMSRGFQMSSEATQMMNSPLYKPKQAHEIIWRYILGEQPLDLKLQRSYAPSEDTHIEAWMEGRGGSYVTEAPYASMYAVPMETGVISFIIIMAIYLGTSVRMWRLAKTAILRGDGNTAGYALAGLFGLVHILSIIWADNYLEVQFITFPAWFMVGMAYLRGNLLRGTGEEMPKENKPHTVAPQMADV